MFCGIVIIIIIIIIIIITIIIIIVIIIIYLYILLIYIYIFIYITDVLRVSGGPAYLFGHPFFQMYFNKKYVEVVITDFTKHLMISKWLRRQKC